MYKIKRDSSYVVYYDTFTVEPKELSVLIIHNAKVL